MSAEEDAGILQSLTFLASAQRVDLHRVLVLRTASNYVMPAYRVGSAVVNELASHWTRYAAHPPTATP